MDQKNQIRFFFQTKKSIASAPERIEAKVLKVKNKEKFLTKRIQICSQIYDFTQELKNSSEKAKRLKALQELRLFLNHYPINYHSDHWLVFKMICKNIFRPLPLNQNPRNVRPPHEGIEVDIFHDPSWIHLKGVYEIFLDSFYQLEKIFQKDKLIKTFTQELIYLFNSENEEERLYLWRILQTYYDFMIGNRKLIRETIYNLFITIIEKKLTFNGISELLVKYSAIISVFLVPLREDQLHFFHRILIPLHFLETSHLFHKQLIVCSVRYVEKNHSLAIPLFEALLKNWPFGNDYKEPWFLAEINDVITVCEISELESFIPKLTEDIIRCISRSELETSEKIIHLIESGGFFGILRIFKQFTFPLIFKSNSIFTKYHWSSKLIENYYSFRDFLKNIDQNAFNLIFQSQKHRDFNQLYLAPKN
jgi:hypothetical protein